MKKRKRGNCLSTMTLAGLAIFACIRADGVGAAAIVDNAEINLYLLPSTITLSDGTSYVDDDDGLVYVGIPDAFTVLADSQVGHAAAEVDGFGGTFHPRDDTSAFHQRIDVDASADAPPLSSATAAGQAEGELTITNTTGEDLIFNFFLEIDTFWDDIAIDDPTTEIARLAYDVVFGYDGTMETMVDLVFEGDGGGGFSSEDVCPVFPNDICNIRRNIGDLSLPAGATRTMSMVSRLSAFAEVGENAVSEPGVLWTLAPVLGAMALRRRWTIAPARRQQAFTV